MTALSPRWFFEFNLPAMASLPYFWIWLLTIDCSGPNSNVHLIPFIEIRIPAKTKKNEKQVQRVNSGWCYFREYKDAAHFRHFKKLVLVALADYYEIFD